MYAAGGFHTGLLALGTVNANTFQGMKRWRENRWVLGDEFIDVQTGFKVQQRIHAYICPELHLLADELDQAEKWALSAGLAGLWVEGYPGPKGGKAAGIGLCSDASVGLEKHKATGGAKLDIGHLVAGYIHMGVPGGFNLFGIYLRVGGGIIVDNAHTLSCLERAIKRSHGEWIVGVTGIITRRIW